MADRPPDRLGHGDAADPFLGVDAGATEARAPGPFGKRRRRERIRRIAAATIVIVGVLDLVTALVPLFRDRLADIVEVVSVAVVQTAGVGLVFVGTTLCLLGRGLRRGHRLALLGTEIAIATSVVLHLLQGLQLEPAAVGAAAGALLWTQRSVFTVRATRATVRRVLALAVGGVLTGLFVATLLVLAVGVHQRVDESTAQVLRRIAVAQAGGLPGGRFVSPAWTASMIALLVVVGWRLLSPRLPEPHDEAAHLADRERARTIVAAHGGDTLAYFALRDDKRWFFSGSSVVAYAVRNGVCLVSPDPIGPEDEREQVWSDFSEFAELGGWSVAVVGASRERLPVYQATGLRAVYLGDEAVLDCLAFTLQGGEMKSLRGARNRLLRAGCSVSFHDPSRLEPSLARSLQAFAGATRRGDAERGFSMTLSRLFDPLDTGLLLTVAHAAGGQPLGFIQWVPSSDIDGWSLDVMRRSDAADAPNGVTDFMVLATAERLRDHGGGGLCLNFTILRALLADRSPTRTATLVKGALHRLSEHAQIESLWRFNEKYRPQWRPRYVVLDAIEHAAAQGLAIAEVEGMDEIPVIGRFLSRPRR